MNNELTRTWRDRFGWNILWLSLLLLTLVLVNLFTGSVKIPLREAADILFFNGEEHTIWKNILLKSRMPQTFTALIAGSALAVSGLQMQTLFRNPLAGPSVLGISSGASLGVALVVLLFKGLSGYSLSDTGIFGNLGIAAAAFGGAMGVLSIIMLASRMVTSNTVLLIIGIMMGYAGSSLVGILKFYSDQADLKNYVIWGLGSFSNVTSSEIPYLMLVLGTIIFISLFFTKQMNLYLLGESYAQNLGVDIKGIRFVLILLSGLLVAITTAYTGPIAFLGLAVPHIGRNLFLTSDHRKLLPYNIFLGAIIALLCNMAASLPGFEGAIPINTITSIIGAPIVIWVIIKQRNSL